jgi:small subunit ribosomal protein S2
MAENLQKSGVLAAAAAMVSAAEVSRRESGAPEQTTVHEIPVPYLPMPITVRTLLDAGAHFGHKAEKWNPKMLPYIYGQRNRIHIINLDLTLELWERARKFITDVSSRGGHILFVGTKQQAREIVREAAERCGAYYVNHRWLGGTLSNFETIKNSINRMGKLEELLKQCEVKDSQVKLSKKERLGISRQLEKLAINLMGIRSMKKLPDVIVAIDIIKENIAVAEARKLHIPLVAVVDTNTDPTQVAFPVPANDDAVRTIKLFANAVADAILEGRQIYQARLTEMEAQRAKQEAAAQAQSAERAQAAAERSEAAREAKEAKEKAAAAGE